MAKRAKTKGKRGRPEKDPSRRTEIGERIWRLYKGKFTRKEFAKAIGKRGTSVWELEYGESHFPSSLTAIAMAKVLETTVEYIVTGEGPRHRPLPNYPPDVVDIATMLAQLSEQDRRPVRAMVEQMLQNSKEQRIATTTRTTREAQ